MQDPVVTPSIDPAGPEALVRLAPAGVAGAMPLRGAVALRLVDLAMFMLRVSAILVLLSPILAVGILLG